MTKSRYKGIWCYCDKSDCKYWGCTLSATEEVRAEIDPEIDDHACFVKKEDEGE